MKAVTVKELRKGLDKLTPKELRELCLRLSKFKKENKELLTYILFESADEASFTESVKSEIDRQFNEINRRNISSIKKGFRKILLNTRRNIRYSQDKTTEINLLIYFCKKVREFTPSVRNNLRLRKIYDLQLETILNKVSLLHEDLKYDYDNELKALVSY